MNRKELVEAILKSKELNHLTKKDADAFLNKTIDVIKKTIKKGEDVSLIGFGSFSVRERSARTGKNPQTGETIQIAASKSVGFKAGKSLKDAVNS